MTDLQAQLQKERERAAGNPFISHNHIQLAAITENGPEAYVDLVPESHNFSGGVHGGLLFALSDYCAAVTARMDGRRYVTQTADVHFIRGVKEGRITGHGRVLHRGRSGCLTDVRITDEDGRLLFKASVFMYCISERQ